MHGFTICRALQEFDTFSNASLINPSKEMNKQPNNEASSTFIAAMELQYKTPPNFGFLTQINIAQWISASTTQYFGLLVEDNVQLKELWANCSCVKALCYISEVVKSPYRKYEFALNFFCCQVMQVRQRDEL